MMHNIYENSTPYLGDLKLEIPVRIADVILKMMKKNSDDRYQTATELLTALREIDPISMKELARIKVF